MCVGRGRKETKGGRRPKPLGLNTSLRSYSTGALTGLLDWRFERLLGEEAARRIRLVEPGACTELDEGLVVSVS